MEHLRPNDQRAKSAIAFIWAVMALDIVALFSSYMQYGLLEGFNQGVEITAETADANDNREQLIGIVQLIVMVISMVTFIRWFRRAYFNLHLKVQHLSETENWAAIAWFIPIVCLYKPYRIMQELYRETAALLTRRGHAHHVAGSSALVGWWWALWVIASIIGQIAFRTALNSETIDGLLFSTYMNMMASVIGIPLAIITVQVVKGYARMEVVLAGLKDEDAPAPSPVMVTPP